MIKRQEIRDKIEALLDNNEFKRHYFTSSGEITTAASANGDIDDAAIDSLLAGYFGDTVFAEAKNATIVIVNATIDVEDRTSPMLEAGGVLPLHDANHNIIYNTKSVTVNLFNDIPSDEDLATAVEAGFDPTTIYLVTSTTNDGDVTTYNISNTFKYDAAEHGAPNDISPNSYNVSATGDFFGDLNTFALIAGAAYELAIAQSASQLASLKAQLVLLGINVT